jgi:hypothetical protein
LFKKKYHGTPNKRIKELIKKLTMCTLKIMARVKELTKLSITIYKGDSSFWAGFFSYLFYPLLG